MPSSKRIPIGRGWRIGYDEAPKKRGGMLGPSYSLRSRDYPQSLSTGARVPVPTVLDEFVLLPFLHVEQMDDSTYFVELCGQKCMVRMTKGKAVKGQWYT